MAAAPGPRRRATLAFTLVSILLFASGCDAKVTRKERHPRVRRPTQSSRQRLRKRTAKLGANGVLVTPQIVGGGDAPQGRTPYYVWLDDGDFVCGGTLIRRDAVLTAAHCVWKSDPSRSSVIPGPYQSPEFTTYPDRTYGVRKIAVHPAWNNVNTANDVAIMFVKACITAPGVKIARLGGQQLLDDTINKTFAIFGFGTTSQGASANGQLGEKPGVLQGGDARRIRDGRCANLLGAKKFLPQSMLCAGEVPARQGGPPPNQDSCQGDSGGPLVYNVDRPDNPWAGPISSDRVLGISSWGDGCGLAGKPGVYTRLPAYLAWVDATLKANPTLCQGASPKPTAPSPSPKPPGASPPLGPLPPPGPPASPTRPASPTVSTPGCRNEGNGNVGCGNAGDGNRGNNNQGSYNIGDDNNGSYNEGNRNQGSNNKGSCNLGSHNTGNGWVGSKHGPGDGPNWPACKTA